MDLLQGSVESLWNERREGKQAPACGVLHNGDEIGELDVEDRKKNEDNLPESCVPVWPMVFHGVSDLGVCGSKG